MKAKEIIENLRNAFNELVNTPVQLAQATLKDGTVVEVTEMAVGGIVTINGTPAPVGEHELQDGTVIVVGDNGAITEIKPVSAMPEEPAMQEDMKKKLAMEEIFSAFETSTNEKFASYESKFASYETKFAEYESKLNKAYGVIEGLIQATKLLSETPTGTPDASVKSENKFTETKPKFNYEGLFS